MSRSSSIEQSAQPAPNTASVMLVVIAIDLSNSMSEYTPQPGESGPAPTRLQFLLGAPGDLKLGLRVP